MNKRTNSKENDTISKKTGNKARQLSIYFFQAISLIALLFCVWLLTREKESMVIAQYRHPNYDLYKRSIMGEIERREDEPAVYRALEEGISGRGLIGIIDEGRTVVRHTVSPILNSEKKVIGALTYEYPNAGADTESIRIINNQEGKQ